MVCIVVLFTSSLSVLSVPLYFTVLRKCSLVVCSTSPSVCHLFSVLLVGRLSLEPCSIARLAQSVERKALNLVVVGSSPTVGASFYSC